MKHLKTFNENVSWEQIRNFRNTLDSDFVEKWYEDNLADQYDSDDDLEMMMHYLDPWDYIDDDKFVEGYIVDEKEYLSSDWGYSFNEDWEKKDQLIPYLENYIGHDITDEHLLKCEEEILKSYFDFLSLAKHDENEDDNKEKQEHRDRVNDEGTEWIFEELDNKHLKDLIDKIGDRDEFLQGILEERFKNQTAKDILGEFYSDAELYEEIWNPKKNWHNILSYLDEDKMAKDMPEPEYEEILERIDIERNESFQRDLLKKYPENILDMINLEILHEELAEEEEYQRIYFEQILKDKSEEYEITLEEIEKLTSLGVEIDEIIIDEFDLSALISGKDMGLL